MWRSAKLLMACSIVGLVAAGSVWAQVQRPMPTPTPPIAPALPAAGSLEGEVKKVDLTEGTVRVATGWFGLLRRTLSVTSDTQVQVDGRQGTLMDVSEGAQVKASYEVRGRQEHRHLPRRDARPALGAGSQGSAPVMRFVNPAGAARGGRACLAGGGPKRSGDARPARPGERRA